MLDIMLTQNSTPVFQYIVWFLGEIMNYIFEFIKLIGIPNIGLAIILFTIVMYVLMMPLTIKQQKFSKLSGKMNPELQAIQAKYKNYKTDQAQMMQMNQETKAVYAKYGVSPSGSCLQLLIQMPILFALYRVIYQIPAYVAKVYDVFRPLVSNINWKRDGEIIQSLSSYNYYAGQFTEEAISKGIAVGNGAIGDLGSLGNSCIDVLNRASSADWAIVKDHFSTVTDVVTISDSAQSTLGLVGSAQASLSSVADATHSTLAGYNNFLGLNIGDSPWYTIQTAFESGAWLLIFGAILVPILAAVTQWINVKLAPQAQQANPNGGDTPSAMTSSLKTMNMVMPIVSAVFCFTLPAGMGIYWIAGAVVRTVQQILINKHFDKINIDEMIKDNIDKYNEKRKAKGLPPAQLNNYAKLDTKKVNKPQKSQEERDAAVKKSTEFYNNNNAKSGSLASKANMVKQYNEKNNK